jgi:putative transposase
MSRTARIVIPDVPYHITQRGNNRQDIFYRDTDRAHYVALLEEHAKEYGL